MQVMSQNLNAQSAPGLFPTKFDVAPGIWPHRIQWETPQATLSDVSLQCLSCWPYGMQVTSQSLNSQSAPGVIPTKFARFSITFH